MDYFAGKSPKLPTACGYTPKSCLDSMTRKYAKTLLPLNMFGWYRCLAILGQIETYILCFLALSSSLYKKKNRFRATKGADIYRRYK